MKRAPAGVEIRWLTENDVGFVAGLSQQCFGPRGLTAAQVLAFAAKPNYIPKVIRVDGKPAGYVLYNLEDGAVFIREVAVCPRQRRRGHGRRLVRHVLRSLPRLKRRIAAVRVPETNLEAQLFFRSLEFKAYRVIKRAPEPYYAMRYVRDEP
jgi:ribosomal-protein-alanine N-acetyltransferase